MKAKIVKVIVAILCLCGTYFFHSQKDMQIDKLTFDNIEALAEGEGSGENYYCYGVGSVDCNGHKVDEKISGFSLD